MKAAILMATVLGSLLVAAAHAETYVVNPDGSGDFPTIQAAIDATKDGDVIQLGDGVFRGAGNRDLHLHEKSITIESQDGPLACTIDCEGSAGAEHYALSAYNSSATIRGLTIINSYRQYGACAFDLGEPRLVDCIFRDNTGDHDGGAVVIDMMCKLSVEGCWFEGNQAAGGGAITCCSSEALLDRCTFVRNRATSLGGAIRL